MALITVDTKNGTVRGVPDSDGSFTVFSGIPYAKPPLGSLRFAPPREPSPWQGVLDCYEFKSACIQHARKLGFFAKEFYQEPVPIDEDCLYLNIWTPAKAASEGLPVFFFLHGGAYLGGYSYEREFDGAGMCGRGCILVTAAYRCGPMGFFSHPELTARNGRSGNAGLEDQLLALKWVHDNISAFGGDPDNVTVHGQSAGAMSTRTLLTSPRAKGALRRVIVQSGGGINDWSGFRTMREQEQLGVELLERSGMSFNEALSLPAQEVHDRLVNTLFAVYGPPGGNLGFHPCVDGFSLLEAAGESIRAGRVNTDSIMCGSVAGDYELSARLPDGVSDRARKERVTAFASQVAWGEWNIINNRRPIYAYFFDHALPGDDCGSWHSCELWYMFGTLKRSWRPWTDYDRTLSAAMLDYWCAFARSGDPNCGAAPKWNAYTADAPDIMCFSDDGFSSRPLLGEPYAAQLIPLFQRPGMVNIAD